MPPQIAVLDRYALPAPAVMAAGEASLARSADVVELLMRSAQRSPGNDIEEQVAVKRPMQVSDQSAGAAPVQVIAGGLAPWQIKRLKSHIDARITERLCLDDLSALVKLSTSYFSAAFKRSFGVPPHNYIVARRVEFAKRQILGGDVPLCRVALDCGLADQAHLTRVFRRVTGTTPSAWRRENLGRGASLEMA